MEDNKRKLYDALSDEFDLGTYEEFERNIGDSNKRRKLFDAASADYDLGDFENYSQKIGPTHKESLDIFNAENGAFMDDFEARDTAEAKISRAGMSSGLYVPTEGSITGEERQRYIELRQREDALKKAWYTSDEYLEQKDADALQLAKMRDSIDRGRMAYAQENPVIEGYNPSATRGADADKEMQMYETASRIMTDAIKMHNAPGKYDGENVFLKFGKGAGDKASDIDFWTMGLSEIADNLGVREVLSSVQNKLGNLNDLSEEAIENILSPAEKAVLQAWAINAQEQLKRRDDLSRAYQGGQGAVESLGFMAEFALTGGVGKLASEGAETMARWLGKKALTTIGGKADDVAEQIIKEAGERIAENTVGKYAAGLGRSLAEAAGRTGVMPSTFRNITEKATEIHTDEEGNNYLVGMNNAFAKGFADSFIENLSEGGRVNALGELIGDVAGKIPAYRRMVDKFSNTKASELLDAFNSSGIMNTLRAGGWHGFGEEYLEEWYGNALRTLTGVDKEALKEFAAVDNQIVTITSFLPMTIFGGTVSTAQVLSSKRDLDKKAEALRSALLERGYDEAQANNMIDMMRGSTPAEVSEFLSPIVNSVAGRSVDEAAALMKPVGEFAEAVRRWQAFDTKYKYQEQEQRDDLRSQMESTIGQFWQEDENGRQTVQRGVNAKGEAVYMLGKPSAEEAEAGVASEVAAVTSDGRKAFVNPADYQLEDELEMNDFLGTEIMAEKRNKEQARMIEEKEAQIAAIREVAVPGNAVNIGTAEAPVQAIVIQRNPDGVIVNTPDGQTRQMTYEEFGNYVGINAVPLTDAQIDEQEADALSAERSQREAALDQEYNNEDAAIEELTEAENEIEQVETTTPLPTKADGSVDQTALWNNDPARWAQWNDEQRQDGGANSLAYINGAIAREEAAVAELTAAYNAEPDFDRRASMEQQIAANTERLQGLVNLRDGYVAQAEAPISQTQQRPQTEEEKAKAENLRREPLRKKAKDLADKLGVKVNIAESISDVKEARAKEEILRIDLSGSAERATGWFNPATGEVTIYLPHTTDTKEIERTIVHEVVAHKGLRGLLGEEGFNVLCDSVWDMMTEEERAKFMSYPGVNGNKRAAADEYIAHYAETLNLEESKPIWDRIMDLIMRILNSMGVRLEMNKEQLSDIIVASYQKLVQEVNGQTNVESAEASEEELQVPVAEADEESEEDTETILNEDGFEVDEQNEDVRFSVRYLPTPEQREGIIDSIIQITGRTREEAERWLESELSLVPIVLNDKEYLDYAPDSKYKAIKDNSDYPQGTVDFNNICRKRKDFTRMYTRLQRAYPNRIFTAEDLADIRTIMSEDGLVVACGLCYVEDRRQKLGEVADEFIKDLQDGFKSYGKKNATKRANAEKFRSFVGADTYVPSIYDLITLEGSDKLHDEHKGIWDAFGAYNRARGQQTQNTFQGYAEYKREILTWSDAKVKKVNSLGGLRIFSYSDFEAHHLLDIIQIIIDCAARGVMIQGYTKVPEFARVVEKTGIKLNRSLIPLGDTGIVDGKLAYDPVEGIDINDPNFLESNDNVGNILIGINDEQIRMAMADPFIHYIIPYHARQAGSIRAKLNVGAWTNYIDTQNERKKSDGKRVEKNINIYTDVLNESITNDREFVEKYLEVCREKGYIPKFDQFLDRDAEGNYVYTPGYYKFLVDFKLFDEAGNILPQKPVVAQFDDAFNAQVLLDYAREERETAGEAMNSTYDKIVETLGLGEPTVGENVRFSESDGPIDLVEEARKAQAKHDAKEGDVRFRVRTEEEREKLFADAKEKYGVTDNFNAAGYMLPDGSLLDFSEANDGGDPNSRSLDHRDIEGVIMDNGVEYDSRWMYIADFMNEGAIRLLPESAGINMIQAPTDEQRKKIFDFIYKYNGEVILEINDERLNSIAYMEYDRRTSPSRIFRDIDGYFKDGIVPQQDMRFRMSNQNQAIFVSNAAKAVEVIKQDKATPEQWLKMIEKNGGLKAGEDKWMGLSDWLKASDKKTLTKQEVLDFVNENMIVIEEQHYGRLEEEVAEKAMHDNMIATYGEDFYNTFAGEAFIFEDALYGGGWDLVVYDEEVAANLYNEYNADKVEYNRYEGGLSIQEKDKVRNWGTQLAREMEAVDNVKEINPMRLKHTTRNLDNKREIALITPQAESWKKSKTNTVHFEDAGDGRAVAWIRFGETTAEDGKRVLVIDEIQSDRHQEARKEKPDGKVDENGKKERVGYRDDAKIAQIKEQINSLTAEQEQIAKDILHKQGYRFHDEEDGKFSYEEEYSALTGRIGSPAQMARQKEIDTELYNLNHALRGMRNGIPAAPFESNWHELAMKRMLRYAAENGYDVIAWTTGEQQAERYNLVREIDELFIWDKGDGKTRVSYGYGGNTIEESPILKNREELEKIVGKEIADDFYSKNGRKQLQKYNLYEAPKKLRPKTIGGEGMKGFYDKMLPAFMNKYGKKWGVKVEDIELPNLEEAGRIMHSVPVTEEMKASVMEGQVMFRVRGENESAMDFYESGLADYRRKYNELQQVEILPVNEETAKRFGLTLDELKKTGGLYVEEEGFIAIFAHEEADNTLVVENAIFHEQIHHLAHFYPYMDKLGEWLWNNTDKIRGFAQFKSFIEGNYDELMNQEMLCYVTSFAMTIGAVSDLEAMVPAEYRNTIRNIENEIGYDRRSEESSRQAERSLQQSAGAETHGEHEGSQNGEEPAGAGEARFRTTGITPEVQDEMNAIKASAIVMGNFMKAPNGKDTNLTEEQWLMVRTKNFKSWFGDWENDPENASKVVDDNGEPKAVYHGSPVKGITEFEQRAARGWGMGSYFTDNKEQAEEEFGNNVYETFLNIRNPYTSKTRLTEKQIASTEVAQKMVDEYGEPDFRDEFDEDGYFANAVLRELGYDGVAYEGSNNIEGVEYVAFRPNQIKSATDNTGAFSAESSDIRFSVRTKPAPKNTGKGYKVFYLKDGKLYPPMVANLGGVDTPVGVWLDADAAPQASTSKTGRKKVKAGGKGTQGGSGTLAYRPGWHLGKIPYALQFNRGPKVDNPLGITGKNGKVIKVGKYFPADFVWAEVEYANEVDYQDEAMSYGYNEAGNFQHSLAGLPKVPEDGSYIYRTNANPATDPWIITGAMKVTRLLTPSEVDQMVIDAGREPQERQEGAVTDEQIMALNKELGLVEEEEEVSFRTTGTPTEDVVAEGVSLSPAQLASLAGDIFAALPEDGRKKITDGLNGNILGLQDAILQIPTSLATKEEWNDEDRQMAEVVAEQMTKAVGIEMTRPFSASEALWALYNAVNKSTDLVSEASRALVRRNLGFDSQTLEMEKDARDGVRFRTAGNASANAQASMYNRGAASARTRLKESFVDMHASVEELVKAIEKRSGKAAEGFENILMALNQQSSRGLAAMEEYEQKFLNKMFDAIRKIMDKTDFKYEDIVRYVILKHGLERNIKLAQRDAKAHYQEIYDDIIAKIKGMNTAQKRTYLTNAQLRDADAKAELARLQAVNTSALTPDQLRDHKKELAKAKKEAAEAAEHLVRAQKIAAMTEQDALDELDKIFKKIEKGTDSVYKEMRKNDYSGISSMFYDTLGVDRKDYATEEEYQAALMQAKADKYDNLGDIEGAAQTEVTLFENAVNTDKLWKSINKATKETLRQQYEANMISKDQYENLRDMFEFYVPLRGFKDNTAEDMYTYYRKPNSTGYTKPILGAEGRKTEAESPFGWIAAMAGSAIASNVKNEAKLALYYFVANRPDNGIATLSKTWFVHTPGDVDANGKKIFRPTYPPFNQDLSTDAAKQAYEDWQEQMRDLQKQGLAYEAGQRLNLGNSVVNISDTNKPEHIVNVKVGGKDYTIVINGNPRAAQAINGDLNIETNETYNNVLLGPWLRWLSSVNTSYNPEFWATNMMRDMAFTMMAVNIKGDPAYRRKFFKNYAKAFKVISMVAKNEKGTLGNSYIERMYKDFVKYGGVTGFTQIKDSETWEKEIERYLKNQDADTTKAMRAVKDGLHAFHRFGESLEQVSRFAAFLTAVETGKSINEAINDAKEITVNFNRKGSGKRITLKEAKTLTKNNGQPLNDVEAAIVSGISYLAPIARSTIMFFNASVQALNAWFKLWKANKLRSLSWVAGYAALGVMNALIHALLDDDDDYLDMPQYERRSSLMLGGNGVYFKWALPQEMSAFYALGELSVETIFGRNPHQSAAAEAAKVMGDMLPVNIAKIIIEKDGWVEAIPSQVKPFLELVRNEDYKGDVIFNEQKWLSEGERERTANWESAYKGTGRPYIEISKLLNNLTDNKDLDEAGWINIHPESLEHVVESMTGGVGRSVSKLFNSIMAAFNPEEDVTVRQFPFLNRILTINDERYKNVHVNDVYDYYAAEAEHALTLKKKYEKDKDKDSYNKLLKSDEYKWTTIYSRYKKPIKQYQEKIKAAEGTKERMELMKQQDELKRKMIKEISDL